jgi:hypothetical protein
MSIEEIEAEALKLDPKARARLAEKLLGPTCFGTLEPS